MEHRALIYLKLFHDNTYGLSIPSDVAGYMQEKGWITWVPPKFGTRLYGLTDAGKAKQASI